MLGIAAVEASEFTVWIVATNGEATGNCKPEVERTSMTGLGSWPVPQPESQYSVECREARLNSWLGFHRDHSAQLGQDAFGGSPDTLPELLEAPALPIEGRVAPRPSDVDVSDPDPSVRYVVGEDAALVAFDGGDGNLTADEVEYMLDWVLTQRGGLLPDLQLDRVVGASYFNDPGHVVTTDDCRRELCTGNSRFAHYPHPDHLAVSAALARTDFGATEGNLVATWPRPSAITYRYALNEDAYCSLMCETPDDTGVPEGLMQSWYGWLAFPGDHWPPTDLPVQSAEGQPLIMSRQQAFLSYYGVWNRVAP